VGVGSSTSHKLKSRSFGCGFCFDLKLSYAKLPATFRTASDSMIRVTPLIIMLIPTSVPIAHTELDGQCT
jgi:hypothetical protein